MPFQRFHLNLLLLYITHITTRISASSSTVPLPLPKDWDTLCPYTDVCTHKAAQSINLTRSQKLCCDTCSCDPDCGLKRNCCLYSMDKYRLDEKYRTTCSSLSTAGNSFGLVDKYMIVDNCPDMSSCYDFEAAMWGSMYPVISNDTGMIYLNEMCAKCHGDLQVQKFVIEVNCLITVSSYVSDGLKIAFTGSDFGGVGCFFRFLSPSNLDIAHTACFEKTINTCPFDATEYDTAQTMCESFNATYTFMRRGFANIYCFLCYQQMRNVHQICNLYSQRLAGVPFSSLLEVNDLLALAENVDVEGEQEQRVLNSCLENELMERKSRRCRKVRCPEWQIMFEGQCSFIGHEWRVGPFVSYLRLDPYTSGDAFPVDQIDKLAAYKRPFFKHTLKHWWRKLYARMPRNASSIPYFVLEMIHKKDQLNPEDFIGSFSQALNTSWTLKVAGKKYRFQAVIHKYCIYHFCSLKETNILPYHLMLVNDTYCLKGNLQGVEILRPINDKKTPEIFRQTHVTLTNLFLCYQVDLLPGEFDDHDMSIFLKRTNRSLEQAEFKRSPSVDGNGTISVCIDSLGPGFWSLNKASPVFLRGTCAMKCTLLGLLISWVIWYRKF